jgi:hypothetical protein
MKNPVRSLVAMIVGAMTVASSSIDEAKKDSAESARAADNWYRQYYADSRRGRRGGHRISSPGMGPRAGTPRLHTAPAPAFHIGRRTGLS